ncbi:MAG: hypothetical protein Ct9H300mP1_19960 [Planctomycetaceae bacterium]|nr:MAG: hypothetical protein Ct9H300mP1_19960 [Planctomycetaceae bacterium]
MIFVAAASPTRKPPRRSGCRFQRGGPRTEKVDADPVDRIPQEHARRCREAGAAEINKAGIENIYFAWGGSQKRDERHYYRVQGPTFLVEYNNTQNSANHVHSIWRNLAGDFNIPVAEGK